MTRSHHIQVKKDLAFKWSQWNLFFLVFNFNFVYLNIFKWFHSLVCTVNHVRACFFLESDSCLWVCAVWWDSSGISRWISNSYLCKKEKTEDEGAEPSPAEFYGTVSTSSRENSPSLSVFACFCLETGILVTPDNEIIPFHEPSDKCWEWSHIL